MFNYKKSDYFWGILIIILLLYLFTIHIAIIFTVEFAITVAIIAMSIYNFIEKDYEEYLTPKYIKYPIFFIINPLAILIVFIFGIIWLINNPIKKFNKWLNTEKEKKMKFKEFAKKINMRRYPNFEDKYDIAELKKLKAVDWKVELLKLNPDYVYWGCFEDYMSKDDDGWDSRAIISSWKEFIEDWKLDDYNELVNFYFEIKRKNHECSHCKGSSLNPATYQLSEDWYDFAHTGRRWDNNLTEIEIEALVKEGRLSDLMDKWYRYDKDTNTWFYLKEEPEKPRAEWQWVNCDVPVLPTPEKVNEWNGKGFGHDAINRWICIKARAKHLGIYGNCEHCEEGEGYIYDEPEAKVALQLWILHPRKGCSRGVYIEHVEQDDLNSIFEFLKEARKRNDERFSKIV